MGMDLLLVRHGQTDWNLEQRVMGRSDTPLNAKGVEQIRRLKGWLDEIEIHAVYSSPLKRTLQTTDILMEGRNGLPVLHEPGVQEIDYGDWVGMTFPEVEAKFGESYQAYRFRPSRMQIPGGEAMVDVQKRGVSAIEAMREKHEGKRVLVVTHSDVGKAILIHYLGIPLDLLQKVGCDNGSVAVYRFGTPWGDRLVALNYFADVKKILPW